MKYRCIHPHPNPLPRERKYFWLFTKPSTLNEKKWKKENLKQSSYPIQKKPNVMDRGHSAPVCIHLFKVLLLGKSSQFKKIEKISWIQLISQGLLAERLTSNLKRWTSNSPQASKHLSAPLKNGVFDRREQTNGAFWHNYIQISTESVYYTTLTH